MLYITTEHLTTMGVDWNEAASVIENAVSILKTNDYAQPIKPYLRYKDKKNRIIAMPAYVGGEISLAGIKWIASFPDNIHKGIPRAHSVTVLNNPNSGKPVCIFNTTMISAIRTAAVSAYMIREYAKNRAAERNFTIGIVGFGPIGQMHLKMVQTLLNGRLNGVRVFDLQPVHLNGYNSGNVRVASSWQECYSDSDIFITCTVAERPYINEIPKKDSLHLNVSLRDYMPAMRRYMDVIIVDDWDEVCRQNTDIENMHMQHGLQREDTFSIIDVAGNKILEKIKQDQVIMFNPMGMAVFDIAIAGYFYSLAMNTNTGIQLPD